MRAVACKKLGWRNKIAVGFRHFLAVHDEHIGVQPIVRRGATAGGFAGRGAAAGRLASRSAAARFTTSALLHAQQTVIYHLHKPPLQHKGLFYQVYYFHVQSSSIYYQQHHKYIR